MVNLNNLIPTSENLFKYLFISGTILIVFAFVYPFQKEKELDLERVELNKNFNITRLKYESNEIQIENIIRKSSQNKAYTDSLNGLKKLTENQISKIKSLAHKNDSMAKVAMTLELNKGILKAEIEAQNEKVETLKKYQSTFSRYKFVFITMGTFMLVVGFIKWWRLMTAYKNQLEK